MERPILLGATRPFATPNPIPRALDTATALTLLTAGATPSVVVLLLQHRFHAPLAAATLLVGGAIATLVALGWACRRHAPRALRDRSRTGIGWHGASDEVAVLAFLTGGALALLDAWFAPTPRGPAPFTEWPVLAGMLYAFGAIALKPVADELLWRGVLAASCHAHAPDRRWAVAFTTLVVAAPSLLWAQAQALGPWLSPWGALVLGAAAALARLRHAALAPAIALHSGAAFVCCYVAALG